MKNKIYIFVTVLLATAFTCSINASEVEGDMTFKIGYLLTDQSDNNSVNRQTFNTYEGFGFSIQDINIQLYNRYNLSGNLSDISKNNRNLRLTASRYGLFSISAYNNQYRRIYSFDGSKFTRREQSGISGYIKPGKRFKLFGGFTVDDKNGTVLNYYRPTVVTTSYGVDYTRYAYNFGADAFFDFGKARIEYRNSTYENDLNFSLDRKAETYKLNFIGSPPNNKQLSYSIGYYHRNDEVSDLSTEFITDSYWGGLRFNFKKQVTADYRLLLSSSEHSENINNSDLTYHTLSLTKAWDKRGGVRLGYEYRLADDQIDETHSSGYLANAWYNFENKLFIRAKYSFISKEVDDGETHIGDTERSRHSISIRYLDENWGGIKAKIEKRIKRYEDISTEVDYTSTSTELYLKHKYSKIKFGYSYHIGEYENRSNSTSYEFSDHVVTAKIIPKRIYLFDIYTTAVYYRSQRDVDIEKLNLRAYINYEFLPSHNLEVTYQLYTYDDLMIIDDTYTANNIEVNLVKNLSF